METCGAARVFAVEARWLVVGAEEPEMPKSMVESRRVLLKRLVLAALCSLAVALDSRDPRLHTRVATSTRIFDWKNRL